MLPFFDSMTIDAARRARYRRGMIAVRLAFQVGLLCAFGPASSRGGEDAAFFEAKVRPVLVERCLECHGEEKQKGGLRLDSRSGWQKGGESGKAIVPGKPEESLLITAISYVDKDMQMPPKKQLAPEEVAVLKEWVKRGAPDPRDAALVASAPKPGDDEWEEAFQKRLDWWSLKPLRQAPPPLVQDAAWSREPVDQFIRAALDAAGLAPAPAAEPEVLLRRLAFVLTGLPPAPALREQFLEHWQSAPAAAYEKLVEDLLGSPHFGEHFARHWMDAVRYTDTYGYEWDIPAKGSWEYRDYLIRAFNGDVSYRQFVSEQLAGDLLPEPRIDQQLGINESLIGPMFYHLGEHRHGNSLQFNGIHQEMVNNKIDAFSKAFLATTVACSRCHNHKLEAVSQRDYYALAAVFMTPRWTPRAVDAPGKNDAAIAKLQTLRGEIWREIAGQWLAASKDEGAWSPEVLKQVLETKGTTEAKAAPVVKKTATTKSAPADKLNDVEYPITLLLKAEDDVEKLWSELAQEWRDAREMRLKANAAFTVVADFHEPKTPDGWVTEGDGMKHGFVEDGTPLIALEGEAVIARLLPRGYHTHALSSKLPGALRMPPHQPAPGKWVSVQLAGGEFGASVAAIENAFLHEGVVFPDTPEPMWQTFVGGRLSNGVTQVTNAFATASLNPVFPGRTGVVKGLSSSDLGYEKRSWISITGIVKHGKPGAPQEMLEHFAGLYESAPPKSLDEAGQRIGGWLTGAVRRWSEGQPQAGDTRVVDWLLAKKLLPNRAEAGSPLASLLAEYRRVEQGIAHPRTVLSMDERECVKTSYPLNVRGNVDTLGELVAPDFLQMFAGRNDVAKSRGSGRLELAESMLQTEHPLTSRVYVNRVWQWLFGAGIVETPDDFGRLGGQPSHPELLDYLAREFMREGWSTKKLVRRLVRSETFRQSGVVSDAAREHDPGNRLLHHYPTRRLEAEAIRDALLAVSGRLDPQLYGRPIYPPRAAEDAKKRLFSGPLDGHGRRSLYLQMSIMAPPVFLAGFNLPDLKLPTGKRDVTNVPGQALAMLNDPLVSALARHWAGQLIKAPHASAEDRVRAMFVQAFGRGPGEAELKRWTAALPELRAPDGDELMEDEVAWSQLAHAFFNAKEFIYYR